MVKTKLKLITATIQALLLPTCKVASVMSITLSFYHKIASDLINEVKILSNTLL